LFSQKNLALCPGFASLDKIQDCAQAAGMEKVNQMASDDSHVHFALQ
jgi:hypothetical protein